MLGLLLRGFFLLGIISWYSASVWKFIDDYFRSEYKKYLSEEFKRNKHLQPGFEISTELPPSVKEDDDGELSRNPIEDELRSCENNLCLSPEELDYDNQLKTVINNRQNIDEDGFINYWHERKRKDNSDNNLYCQPKDINCEDS